MRRAKAKIVKSFVRSSLGPLEEQVLRIVCASGRSTVNDVVDSLNDNHAYTTVMTTLDRLFQKGLLRRETTTKAYVYRPVLTACQLETRVARDLIAMLGAYWQDTPGLLASALVDAVGAYNTALLDKVAEEIRLRQSLRLAKRISA